MKTGHAARLLLVTAMRDPIAGRGVRPSSLSTSALLELHVTTENDQQSRLDDLDALYARALDADKTPEGNRRKQAQVEVVSALWVCVFPANNQRLTRQSALELLKITGSAAYIVEYIGSLKGREDVQWPFSYSKALLEAKMKLVRTNGEMPSEELPNGIRTALVMGAKQGDGYKDFRGYIKGS